MPEFTKPLDIAIAFTKAWTSHDLAKAASFVSDDVVFEGPPSTLISAKGSLTGQHLKRRLNSSNGRVVKR